MRFRNRRSAIPPDAAEVIQQVVRRRRRLRSGGVIAAILLASVSVCSHYVAAPDTAPLAGRDVAVVRIVDGDTLIVRTPDGREERLRLKGVDAPELPHDDVPRMYWAEESTDYLRGRLPAGRKITLEFDGTETRDRFGRLLAYAFGEGADCINVDLVRDGHAYADRRFPGMRRGQIEQAEVDARKKGRGLWQNVRVDQMPEWRRRWLDDRGVAKSSDR